MTNITISDSVTSIGWAAFGSCGSLKSIIIPDSVTEIGQAAFEDCVSLESIIIPDSVTKIGQAAFNNCTSLENITISNSVTSIEGAFSNCTSLTSIIIPDSVTSIEVAFSNCTSLTSITIPNSVTEILGAFFGCTSLTSIIIPDSVTKIGERTFWDCTSLTSVTIPDSVTFIGISAFSGCTTLTDIYYGGSEEQWEKLEEKPYGSIGIPSTATIHYNSTAPTQPQAKPHTLTASVIPLSNFVVAMDAPSVSLPSSLNTTDGITEFTFENGTAGTEYLLIAVNDANASDLLASDNLRYIDQKTANEDGSATFRFAELSDVTYIFIGDFGKGKFCRTVSDTISTDSADCTICAGEPEFSLGDVNGDGNIDASDAATVLIVAALIGAGDASGGLTDTQFNSADVNHDGEVNASDAASILIYAAAIGAGETPVPFEENFSA